MQSYALLVVYYWLRKGSDSQKLGYYWMIQSIRVEGCSLAGGTVKRQRSHLVSSCLSLEPVRLSEV